MVGGGGGVPPGGPPPSQGPVRASPHSPERVAQPHTLAEQQALLAAPSQGRRPSPTIPAHHHHLITGWLSNAILSTLKTMLVSRRIREKNQRVEVVRGVDCIYQ